MIDGVGGAEAIALEEGVKVEGLAEPFVGEDGGDFAGGARDGGGETAYAEGGTIDEKVELVGGGTAVRTAVEVDGEAPILDDGRGDGDQRHRAFADDDVRIVYVTIGGEAVLVEFAEESIGAVVLADG